MKHTITVTGKGKTETVKTLRKNYVVHDSRYVYLQFGKHNPLPETLSELLKSGKIKITRDVEPLPLNPISPIMALKNKWQSAQCTKLEKIYCLRTGSASWAGGDNGFRCELTSEAAPSLSVSSYREWSRNGKWSGNSYSFTLHTKPSWKLEKIEGVITVIDTKNTGHVWWFVQGRGMEVKIVDGYLYKGVHVQAKNFESAVKKVTVQRNKLAQQLRTKRYTAQHRDELAKSTWITFTDSLKAGNCEYGTRSFQRSFQKFISAAGEVGAVRADWLLEVASKIGQINRVERVVNYKLATR